MIAEHPFENDAQGFIDTVDEVLTLFRL